jgi:aryl-alcohol dehydrogenase-like predicted oxidoreductase
LQLGSNLIDTSSSYREGDSEHLIGNVLSGMIEDKVFDRDEIIVMSKCGIINSNYKFYRELYDEFIVI